ncbi:MAG: 16S rRNA (guanine(527)-N(7))-methyltransferase RsmG [Clostridia bacterium]|nr:16S rRNA (guanine(527)-N(7))-methyltransferase RsmG [Clostridia bacterium]
MDFITNLSKINVDLDEKMLASFNTYYEMLVEWNKVMNLTAITEKTEVYVKHFLDSLAIKTVFDDEKLKPEFSVSDPVRVLDVGTGAGFPGIPLKIAFPELEVTLLDSLNKRIKFLNEVIQTFELDKITAIHGRAEDYAQQPDYRESYDLCVSRAVANLSTLSEYCIPYVKVGGYFISYKSGEIEQELKDAKNAIGMLGAKVVGVKKLILPDTDIERSFVIVKKCTKTAGKYPRKAGLPSSRPL